MYAYIIYRRKAKSVIPYLMPMSMPMLMLAVLSVVGVASVTSQPALVSVHQELPPLSHQENEQFNNTNELIHIETNATSLRYAPHYTINYVSIRPNTAIEHKKIQLTVESLHLIPLTKTQIANIDDTLLYNITRSISTLAGIEYFSASRNRYRTFYHESYVVESVGSTEPLPDPVVNDIPMVATITTRQHDSSFGINFFTVDYRYQPNNTLVTLTNIQPVRYLIFELAQPQQLSTTFSVRLTTEGVLFYGLSTLSVNSFYGFEGRVSRSISNRLRALASWYGQQLNAR